MGEPRFIFKQVMEALFIYGLADRMTPAASYLAEWD